MAYVIMVGIVVFLCGLGWSFYDSFRISRVAGIGNLLIWPVPYAYCAYKNIQKVKYSLLTLGVGTALISAGLILEPAYLQQVDEAYKTYKQLGLF